MLPKLLKLYLDTSIFNFAVSTQAIGEKKGMTLQFLDKIRNGRFMAYISPVIFDEIREAPSKKQRDLLDLMEQLPLESLPQTDEVEILADQYVERKIIPVKYYDDALHIAMASVYNLDAIVSWNFEHIVKFKTRREVQAVNTFMGYKTVQICSPQEMM